MKIFLRNLRTHMFYQGPGAWVSSAESATCFETIDAVWGAARGLPLADLEVYVKADGGRPLFGARLTSCHENTPQMKSLSRPTAM